MNFSLLNKLAFIANMAFLTAIIMRIYPFLQGTKLESFVLLTGLMISPLVNLILGIYYGVLFLKGVKPDIHFVQVFNTCIFGLQIILFLFFSGWIPLSNINP